MFSATVAVAPPASSTISTPPIRKRFHMPSHSEGGRSSSFIGVRVPAAPERPRRLAGYPRPMLSPRNRELLGLIPAALLVTAGFTAIFIQAAGQLAGSLDEPHAEPRLERVADLRRAVPRAVRGRRTW